MRLAKTWGRLARREGRLIAMLLLGLSGLVAPVPLGSTAANGQAASPGVPVPSFWDPRRRPERPDLRLTLIRFVSEVDYPPFNYAGPDGNPAGFNVELARLICEELKVDCTVQMRRFDTLIEALNENRARRGDRLDRGLARGAPPRRFQRSLLPAGRPLRRAARCDAAIP